MIRLLLLYSPAIVCGGMAVTFATLGRTDATVILGVAALCVALVLHTCQAMYDNHKLHRKIGQDK